MTEDDDLLHVVRRGDADAVVFAEVVGRALDVAVGGLRLLGVDDVDAVFLFHRAGIALDLVSVEDQNDLASAPAAVVGEDARERLARGGDILRGELFERVPREDDVIAVHEQILGTGLLIFDVIARLVERGARGRALWLERAALDLAVGALEDGEQLLVLGGGAGGRAAACRHGFGGFGGVLL